MQMRQNWFCRKVDPALQLEGNSNLGSDSCLRTSHPLLGASLNCRLCFFPRDLRGPDSCSLRFGVTFLFSPVYRFSSFFVRDVCGFVSFSLVFTLSFSLMFFHLLNCSHLAGRNPINLAIS